VLAASGKLGAVFFLRDVFICALLDISTPGFQCRFKPLPTHQPKRGNMMRKALIALAIAGALTAPMIAQADATLLMQAPGMFFQYEVDQHQPALVAKTVAVDTSRCTMSQPEAVVLKASKSTQWPDGSGLAKHSTGAFASVNGPFERGWRSSTTAA
jgi:hypothetical protein